MESPNHNSPENSTASAKETNPPFKSSKGSMEEDTLKIALEGSSKNEIDRGDSKAVAANSSMAEVMEGVVTDGQSIKKRKTNIEVKDIDPSKYPICPNPNSSKNSTTSVKETNPPIKSSKGSMEEDIQKIALEGLSKNEIDRGDSQAVAANSSMAEVMGGVVSDGQSIKKRKTNIEVKNIDPSKYPICPRCKGEFFTYNAAIEHLQKNPNCASSGTSNPSQSDLNKGADKVQPMEIEESSNAAAPKQPAECKGCGFDLNELPPHDEDE